MLIWKKIIKYADFTYIFYDGYNRYYLLVFFIIRSMSNFLIGYYYYFFCLVVFFGITYYLVTYIQYKKYYLSKFFIILISAVVAYLSFYFFFIYGVNTQLPDVTALSVVNTDDSSVSTIISSSNSHFSTIQISTMLLVFFTIMYYVLRNLISTISELLIDYMDPERDMVMKLFKVFFFTLMFILFPYLVSDAVILSLI